MNVVKGIRYNVSHYFSKRVSRQLGELYASVGIMDFAVSAIAIFEPIYLWTLGYSLQTIMLFYLAVYGIYFLIIPFGGKFVGAIGYEKTIFISTFFLILFYLCLFLIPHHPVFFVLAIFIYAIQKMLYWPAYHGDFAEYSDEADRGREAAGLATISMFVYVLGPFVGGFILKFFSFNVLFLVVSLLFLVSNLPLLVTKEKIKKTAFSYFATFKMIINRKYFRSFIAYLGFGEELIVMTVWPIFIYWMIEDFFSIGSLVALSTLITGIILLYIGKLTDKKDKKKMIKTGTIFYSFNWFMRLLAATGLHVFFIDAFSRIFKDVIFVPVMALTYDRANKSDLLKSVIFFEQSLAFGKFLAALIVFILLFFFSGWTAAFLIAAAMTFLYILL